MYKLSVIVPVYNAGDNLRKCLESILIQKTEDVEILIINDGSTDNSGEIINEYASKYPQKLTCFEKENTGIADTRNFGISKANGKYIFFVDSDDYIETTLIKKLQTYMEQDIDIIKFKAEYVDQEGNTIMKINGPVFSAVEGQEAFNKLVFIDNLIDALWVYIFKKDLFVQNNLFFKVGTYHEDVGLIPLLLLIAKSVISLDLYGYFYVQTDNSITRNSDYTKTIKKFEDTLLHYDNMLQFINKFDIKDKTKENIKIYYTNAILLKLKTIKKEDRKNYIKQIKQRKMIKNIKVKNVKQLVKRIILSININWYLNIID